MSNAKKPCKSVECDDITKILIDAVKGRLITRGGMSLGKKRSFCLFSGLIFVGGALAAAIFFDPRWTPLSSENIALYLGKIRVAIFVIYLFGLFLVFGSQISFRGPLASITENTLPSIENGVILYNKLSGFNENDLEYAVFLFRQHLGVEGKGPKAFLGIFSRIGSVVPLISSLFPIINLFNGGYRSGIFSIFCVLFFVISILAILWNAAVSRGERIADIADYVIAHAYEDDSSSAESSDK
ncbi:hypothetical protein [Acetobacter estunensis]|uniref:hypothetical protein n=1 Tax=Acetobacter estunensis TaxID=104097 RepID=UPI001407ADA5|nr:hypothetical protein [Acetobacter estunensis]